MHGLCTAHIGCNAWFRVRVRVRVRVRFRVRVRGILDAMHGLGLGLGLALVRFRVRFRGLGLGLYPPLSSASLLIWIPVARGLCMTDCSSLTIRFLFVYNLHYCNSMFHLLRSKFVIFFI